jgi:hypothetical protein
MPVSPTQKVNTFRNIQDLLTRNGVPQPVAGWAAAAVFHETGDLTSRVSKADKNYSGIKWINKPYQPATKGGPAPRNEGGGNYARYKSTVDWAKDYARILKLSPGRPYQATSIPDFAARLKANKYFTDNPVSYARGVQSFYNKYTAPAAQADNNLNTARADFYAKQGEGYKQQLQTRMKWDEFQQKYLTTKNLLIAGGVVLAYSLLTRR